MLFRLFPCYLPPTDEGGEPSYEAEGIVTSSDGKTVARSMKIGLEARQEWRDVVLLG